ncbi:MAG: hypothetical protein ACXWJ8_15575, partial [Xanthobacteraceae bacterium]
AQRVRGDHSWRLRQCERHDPRRALIGMIQSLGAVYISNAYSTSIAFGLLVLTLIFFPRGLVPERVDENV